jgi:hypothetical protein
MSFYNFLRYFANFVFYFSYGNNPWGIFHVCQHKIFFSGFAVGWNPFLSVRTLERMIEPNTSKSPSRLYCKICDCSCSSKRDFDRHLLTAKHTYRTSIDTDLSSISPSTFHCSTCNYTCSKGGDYNRHLATARHIGRTGSEPSAFSQDEQVFPCPTCNKVYKRKNSLWYHMQKCALNAPKAPKSPPPENIVHESTSEATIMKCFQMMEEQNAAHAEQTRLLIEAISLKGPQCITNNNNNNTTNNNQFNLNVFLNEDCKDAYTLKEVINSIECTVMDLDRMDTDGYAATITRKILESMQNMSITERPIHCTDSRRNTVCVKDETGWEKNEKAMKLLVDSVFRVGRKLGSIVDDWKMAYPDHFRGTVSRREQYHRLIMDILKVSDLDVEGRIASKVCKGIVLDRKTAMDR